MKVVYFSNSVLADCDFPLIKEMQKRGIDVRYYIPIGRKFSNASILEVEKPIQKWGICKASKITGMEKYKDCLDLDKLYFICGANHIWWPFSWVLWICVYFHIFFFRPDIMHITWQLKELEKILYHIPFVSKKVMTVHDPLQHSSTSNYEQQEKLRRRIFRWANGYILLNTQQVDVFCKVYGIEKDKILVSKLGIYDSIKYFKINKMHGSKPYILFFGQIFPYKGVEYLLDAMLKIHDLHYDTELIVAGKGEIYWDNTKYANKEYIKIENRYFGITELAGLVKNALFVVCPYKDATQSGVVQTSFALNVPIVATNVGALPDMVKDNIYGKIVPPCDVDALAKTIQNLIESPQKIEEYKQNIRKKYLPSMSWTPIAKQYVDFYNK